MYVSLIWRRRKSRIWHYFDIYHLGYTMLLCVLCFSESSSHSILNRGTTCKSPNRFIFVLLPVHDCIVTYLQHTVNKKEININQSTAYKILRIIKLYHFPHHTLFYSQTARLIWVCLFYLQVTKTFGVTGLKASMELFGLYGGPTRSPLLPLKDSQLAELKNIFKFFSGFQGWIPQTLFLNTT